MQLGDRDGPREGESPRDTMRRRREELDLTQEQVAFSMGIDVSTYRGWESGRRRITTGYRRRLAEVLRVTLTDIAGWFDTRPLAPVSVSPNWLGTLAALEQGASELWTFEPIAIPGLAQTAAYAAAVQRRDIVTPSDAEVDKWVRARLARQRVLDPPDRDPLRLSVVLDEAVLHRVPSDGQVMADQLDHLAGLAERTTVDIRVLPLRPGTYLAAFGAFTLLTAPGMTAPYMLVLLDHGSAHYFERSETVVAHAELFRDLQSVALSQADSLSLIRTAAQEHRT